MKINFTDANGINYIFEPNGDAPFIREQHISITADKSFVNRFLINNKIKWEYDDGYYMSEEAKRYAQKLIDNMAFI
jgi:hypothetical protein